VIAAIVLWLLPASSTPTPPKGPETMSEYAARRRLTPHSVIAEPGRARVINARIDLLSCDESLHGNELWIDMMVENLLSREMDLIVRITADREGGGVVSKLFEADSGWKIPGNARARLHVRLPEAVRVTRLVFIDPVGLSGTIETEADKAQHEKEKACLDLRAINPNGTAASESVEVRVRNRCTSPIRSDRTWFLLVVRDSSGRAISHRYETFHEDLRPGGELRRVVIVPVPAGSALAVSRYTPQ
jgi:hypothetical protein